MKKSEAIKAMEALCQKHGEIQPHMIVKAAEPKDSPLHQYFDWNDRSCGHKFRLAQARGLIRRFRVEYVTPEGGSHKTRRLMSVIVTKPRENEGAEPLTYRAYVPTERVIADDDMRSQVLHEALTMAKTWKSKYGVIRELAPISDAIEIVSNNLRDDYR